MGNEKCSIATRLHILSFIFSRFIFGITSFYTIIINLIQISSLFSPFIARRWIFDLSTILCMERALFEVGYIKISNLSERKIRRVYNNEKVCLKFKFGKTNSFHPQPALSLSLSLSFYLSLLYSVEKGIF